jgi:uncharacterized membrane protein SpoIIM required for sporulation
MREVVFVKHSNDRWKKFEQLLINKDTDNPDEISSLYIQLIDDLSYARTFYPQSPTYKYLNELSGRAHQLIYKNKKEKRNRIVNFWKTELPLLFYRHHKQLLIAFIIFIVSTLIGIISAANDDSFVRLIMGDGYVDMTIENIKNGHPLAVYNSGEEVTTFIGIAYNNIQVALSTYVLGLFFSLGTAFMLFRNGIMLGAFQYFFYQYGVLKESLLTIWLHGTIEISVCIIAGCAGLVMGNSILFPGTYTRMQSFRAGATGGLKIVIGTVPFFLIAAFIESFVTRHARASHIFDALVILLSLALIIGYFVIYPIRLNRKLTTAIETNE